MDILAVSSGKVVGIQKRVQPDIHYAAPHVITGLLGEILRRSSLSQWAGKGLSIVQIHIVPSGRMMQDYYAFTRY